MARIKLEWTNGCDIGDTLYQRGFTNTLYFDTIIGIPKTSHITEGNENGDGDLQTTFQRRVKTYEMTVFVPEYILDALQDVRLHDVIKITQVTPYRVYEVIDKTTFQVQSNFEFNEQCMATAIITFEAHEVLIKSGCCTKFDLPPCYYDITWDTVGCGSILPLSAKLGQYFLFGAPSIPYPGYFDFIMYQYTINGWAQSAVQPAVGDYICCLSDVNPGECDAYYMFDSIPDPYPTGNGSGPNIEIYSLIPSIIELITFSATELATVRIRAPRGSWNTLLISSDCVNYTTINTTEVDDVDLMVNGIEFTLPVACGNYYCIKLISRKTSCQSLDYDFNMFRIPDPLNIWLYVDRVYEANSCPIPFWQITPPTKVYLILPVDPAGPCTNDPSICTHINEVITRSPLFAHALLYFTPSDCSVIFDKATQSYWLWNGSDWQNFDI